MVAYILNTDPSLLEEGIIDKDEYVETFNSFFAEGGRNAIAIYYQLMEPPPFGILIYLLQGVFGVDISYKLFS